MTHVSDVIELIRASLVEMGADAIRDGKPYGLRGYPDFHRECFPGSFRVSAWEEPITAGLSMRLNRKGIDACTEQYLPQGGRCDLVLRLNENERLWIEVKTAFRPCLRPNKVAGALYAYHYDGDQLYDPKGTSSWIAGVGDIAKKDFKKLQLLTKPLADHVGILLLGFDMKTWPLTDQELYTLLPPELDSWTPAHVDRSGLMLPDQYPVRGAKGFRDRLWFWHREVS
jgi:hypothetical protein